MGEGEDRNECGWCGAVGVAGTEQKGIVSEMRLKAKGEDAAFGLRADVLCLERSGLWHRVSIKVPARKPQRPSS